jgi:hypothetical protein
MSLVCQILEVILGVSQELMSNYTSCIAEVHVREPFAPKGQTRPERKGTAASPTRIPKRASADRKSSMNRIAAATF